jgi:riboflavin biosynthesis pyrimidine reductase
VLVVAAADADPDRVAAARDALGPDAVVQAGTGDVDLTGVVQQLGERGLSRVLCEGGPSLMSDLVAAGLLDELCLTVSPRLVGGDGPRITTGGPLDLDLRLGHVVSAQSVLLTRWLRG